MFVAIVILVLRRFRWAIIKKQNKNTLISFGINREFRI